MRTTPSPFMLSLPKAELHLHLEGSIEPSTLLELRQRHGMVGASLGEVEQLYKFTDFPGFLSAFKDVTGHLRTPEDYELITYRLMERLKAQNILHAEVIVSVGVCLWRKQDFAAIFEGLERGRGRGEKDFGVSLLWIFDAVRQFGGEKGQRVLDFAIQFRDRNVVAFGIGGDERNGPADWFAEVYIRAAEHGLHRTAHAGESDGPDSIWGALNLKAERIGHGLTAEKDPELIEELAERAVEQFGVLGGEPVVFDGAGHVDRGADLVGRQVRAVRVVGDGDPRRVERRGRGDLVPDAARRHQRHAAAHAVTGGSDGGPAHLRPCQQEVGVGVRVGDDPAVGEAAHEAEEPPAFLRRR